MRNDFVDSLLLGVSVGFIALTIHVLTDSAAPQYQLLALVIAGAALFVVQLMLTLRRAQPDGQPPKDRINHAKAAPRFRPSRRNPFFRELTSDWTGLDEYPPASAPPLDGPPETRGPARLPRERDDEDAG